MTPQWGNLEAKDTWRVITAGFLIAIIITAPFYSWVFAKEWSWAQGFPIGWLGIGLTYMATFFHEIGHTIFAWFYGYFTLPSFDLKHGGGMAWSFGGQQIVLLLLLWAAIGYGLYAFRGYKTIQITLILLLGFNLLTAFNTEWQNSVIDFMGPAFVPLIAAFFLIRALFNLAPRGVFERFLNALFGFGMIFHVFVDAYGLLNSAVHRVLYYEQKGAHGFGDFDKVAGRFAFLDFENIILIWAGLALTCLVCPFILYWCRNHSSEL